MEEAESLGGGASAIRYFRHKCLNQACSRVLIVVLNARNICGLCFHDLTALSQEPSDDDGEDEEEGKD